MPVGDSRASLKVLCSRARLYVLAALLSVGRLQAQSDAIRAVALDQIRAKSASQNSFEVESASLDIVEVELESSARFRLFRVWEGRKSHFHPVLVGVVRGQAVGLGGFASPELGRVAAPVEGVRAPGQERSVAQTLAKALDPYGAYRVLFPFDQTAQTDSVIEIWRSAVQSSWARDSIWVAGDGTLTVRTTVLSKTDPFEAQWHPLVYVFQYQVDGRLKAWWCNTGASKFRVPEAQ